MQLCQGDNWLDFKATIRLRCYATAKLPTARDNRLALVAFQLEILCLWENWVFIVGTNLVHFPVDPELIYNSMFGGAVAVAHNLSFHATLTPVVSHGLRDGLVVVVAGRKTSYGSAEWPTRHGRRSFRSVCFVGFGSRVAVLLMVSRQAGRLVAKVVVTCGDYIALSFVKEN